ncbi:MAG: hypothetical protein IKA02_05545, partial [Clostridia bacterium]|nr:hypothetical protein [Clostridia bacterium]
MKRKLINNDVAAYYFHQGTNFYSYDYLGCHENISKDGYEYVFRVWAPNADSVRLVSDFTSWDVGEEMDRVTDSGIWEIKIFSDCSLIGKFYKFKIWNSGNAYYKADPYAFHSQTHLNTASIVSNIDGFNWNDESWMHYRKSQFSKNSGTESEKYYNASPV